MHLLHTMHQFFSLGKIFPRKPKIAFLGGAWFFPLSPKFFGHFEIPVHTKLARTKTRPPPPPLNPKPYPFHSPSLLHDSTGSHSSGSFACPHPTPPLVVVAAHRLSHATALEVQPLPAVSSTSFLAESRATHEATAATRRLPNPSL